MKYTVVVDDIKDLDNIKESANEQGFSVINEIESLGIFVAASNKISNELVLENAKVEIIPDKRAISFNRYLKENG